MQTEPNVSNLDGALSEFIEEGIEILERVGSTLRSLELGNSDGELIDSLYRDMHTLKGTAALFGYSMIANVAHVVETSLEPVRSSKGKNISKRFLNILFQCLGLFEKLFVTIQAGHEESILQQHYQSTVAELIGVTSLPSGEKSRIISERGSLVISHQNIEREKEALIQVSQSYISKKPDQQLGAHMDNNKSIPITGENKQGQSSEGSTQDSTIRVPVNVLDKLMNLVGELVLVRNQVLQFSQLVDDLDFLNLSQNLNIVTTDLQAEVMRTRMQPIGSIVGKIQRVVRDIANSLTKKIDVTIQGADTEVDKTLLEAVKDPLTHIIRNSCDHGIEVPAERKAKGKPETGIINIRAYHEGGQVVIEITDDGKGLNLSRITQKAIEKGLITQESADQMSDRDCANLIFLPGFSTAEQVSAVSGRGVGMDVVKTNIEKIGGAIDLVSQPEKGMTISMRIPLTLAIVPAMIVRSSGDEFAIPQVKLVELVRVEKGTQASQQIDFLHGKPVLHLRGHLLSLVHLKQVLGQVSADDSVAEIKESDSNNIVVLQSDGHSFGLIVDEIVDTGDIVVKPIGQFLKSLETFSGSTIMGDGSVALILDVGGVARRSIEDSDGRVQVKKNLIESNEDSVIENFDAQDFLLFETNSKGKYALPLCLVHRLEEFAVNEIEYSGDQKVIRYRNNILPIITVNKVLGFAAKEISIQDDDRVSVIVVQKNSKSYGVEVNSILDVISIESMIDDSVRDRKGIMGSTIHNDEVIVVVDILNIIDDEGRKHGVVQSPSELTPKSTKRKAPLRVLLAEDTPFFRKQITKCLEKSGLHVTVAVDGAEALKYIKENQDTPFDLVVSDIEMPNMNGLQLARAIREIAAYQDVPLVAVTSKFKQRDREEGESAGFNRYLEKLNEEVLLREIKDLAS